MDRITIDSSSDEDDPYTNSVARLRALKKQRFEIDEFSLKNVEQQINVEDLNSKEINSEKINSKEINGKEINNENIYSEEINHAGMQTRRMVRNRRNKAITTEVIVERMGRERGRGRGRGRQRGRPVDIEYVEMMREEKPHSTLGSCQDIIALSDDDNEDENYEINIKVCWRSIRIDRLSMRRHDSFKRIFQYYADLEKVSVNEVLIMKKDKVVNHTDTPASLKLSVIDILDGGIVNPGMTMSKDKNDDEDVCTIKVQTANKKQSLTIPLKKNEQFKALFANCAKQLGMKENNLKFYFDGDQISSTDTPESLDLEGEACIDLHIST